MRKAGFIRLSVEELGSRLLKRNSSSLHPVRLEALRYNPSRDMYELYLTGGSLPPSEEGELVPFVDANEYLA